MINKSNILTNTSANNFTEQLTKTFTNTFTNTFTHSGDVTARACGKHRKSACKGVRKRCSHKLFAKGVRTGVRKGVRRMRSTKY